MDDRRTKQLEKFARVEDPALLKRAGSGRLVAHQHTPRFVGCVDLSNNSLKILQQTDNLHGWSKEHMVPGRHPQAALFDLCSAMIEWARENRDAFPGHNDSVWSPLPADSFAGRSATDEDLQAGAAYFVLEGGQPIDIPIPQYAYSFDAETNEPIPCILLQAEEEPRGDKIVAYLNLRTNKKHLGHFDQFRLLGQERPETQPAKLATPSYEHLHQAVKNLSALVSAEKGSSGKRNFLRSNQETINALLSEGLHHCSALESFTLIDAVKSLVARDLFLRRRAMAMGIPAPDIMFHGIDANQTCSLVEDDPEVCVFSLYQTPEEEFYGFLVCVEAGELRAERFPIATGSVGRSTAEQLRQLLHHRMWEVPAETEGLLFPMLELFGSSVIPRLLKLESPRKLVIIPHRWTHILPLHMMMVPGGDSMVTLDEVVIGTTFAGSLTSYQWSAKSTLAAVDPDKARFALLCVDLENLGSGARFELAAYRNMFADAEGVDIVTSASKIPKDLSVYPIVVWSGHGISDPTSWERSRLLFESEIFSAERISRDWDLRTAFVAILAACETGIDLSADETLDEYMGLDMALQIAGCSNVVSTMWRVEEDVAGYTAVQLLEGALLNQSCAEHLRVIRQLFKTGRWHYMVESAYKLSKEDASLSRERRARRLEGLEHLLGLPKDAFEHPSQWGVFRSFGK